jgi:hypothetical protein
MSDDLNTIIGYQVQSTAEWRQGKGCAIPKRLRNLTAAEKLERLAAQIKSSKARTFTSGRRYARQVCRG